MVKLARLMHCDEEGVPLLIQRLHFDRENRWWEAELFNGLSIYYTPRLQQPPLEDDDLIQWQAYLDLEALILSRPDKYLPEQCTNSFQSFTVSR